MVTLPAYMHPDTARELLALSRERIRKLREQRAAYQAFKAHGFDAAACAELAALHVSMGLPVLRPEVQHANH